MESDRQRAMAKMICDELYVFLERQPTRSMRMASLMSSVKGSFRLARPALASMIGEGPGKVGKLKTLLLLYPEKFQINGGRGREEVRLVSKGKARNEVVDTRLEAEQSDDQRNDDAEVVRLTFGDIAVEQSSECPFTEKTIRQIFNDANLATAHASSSDPPLVTGSHRGDRGYMGATRSAHHLAEEGAEEQQNVFLNTSDPFCAVVTGVQGSGKSHTTNVILENCLFPCSLPAKEPLVRLAQPMAALVLHYDESDQAICEAIGLARSAFKDVRPPSRAAAADAPPRVERVVVLVSPSYYEQRKQFYANRENCTVHPLLFSWPLSADQLKILMRIGDDTTKSQPLYVSVMLNYLRGLQRSDEMPSFKKFLEDTSTMFDNPNQSCALEQRLSLLTSFVREADENAHFVDRQDDFRELFNKPGVLVVADLTDPMMSRKDATSVFHILLTQFRQLRLPFGKVVAFDEAHKYLDGTKSGLADAIVTTVRLMRHEGIRVLISTQSPVCLPRELFELVTVAVLHCTHSSSWLRYLSDKIPISADDIDRVRSLKRGEALVFATAAQVPIVQQYYSQQNDDIAANGGPRIFTLRFRRRLTVDYGSSRLNTQDLAPQRAVVRVTLA